jgi:hypothetical protein
LLQAMKKGLVLAASQDALKEQRREWEEQSEQMKNEIDFLKERLATVETEAAHKVSVVLIAPNTHWFPLRCGCLFVCPKCLSNVLYNVLMRPSHLID